MTKTGMKAPQGTGMVVASADIQNCRQDGFKTEASGKQTLLTYQVQSSQTARNPQRGREKRGLQNSIAWVQILTSDQVLWQLLLVF